MAVLGLATNTSLDDEINASFLDINRPDADGRTPLSWAAFRGDFRCVRKLLLNGASPDIPARDGCIPLHMAARAGSLPCVKLLVRYGSRVDHQDHCGNTALHYSCKRERQGSCFRKNYLRCAECLLQSGSKVDAQDCTGKTSLRVCIESSDSETALLLLDHGASIHAFTRDGMTLLLAAIFYNRAEMLKLLIEKNVLKGKEIECNAVTSKAIAQSNAETRNVLRASLDPATYRRLLVNIEKSNH